MIPRPLISTLFPYTTLFRSASRGREHVLVANVDQVVIVMALLEPDLKQHLIDRYLASAAQGGIAPIICLNKARSEEHTSELQSLRHLVCRLLLEKKRL